MEMDNLYSGRFEWFQAVFGAFKQIQAEFFVTAGSTLACSDSNGSDGEMGAGGRRKT